MLDDFLCLLRYIQSVDVNYKKFNDLHKSSKLEKTKQLNSGMLYNLTIICLWIGKNSLEHSSTENPGGWPMLLLEGVTGVSK